MDEKPKIQFWEFQATITEMDTKHANLWEFKFNLSQEIEFKAGQYVSIYLPEQKPCPFSIASSPANKKTLDLGVEVVGKVTGMLAQMKPGEVVTMKGPFGNFVIDDFQRKVCFLAGGIGITPFMSMFRWIRDESPDKYAVMFYSCKTKDQFMWFDEIENMHKTNANLKTIFTLTREQPEGWPYETGRCSEEMFRKHLPDYMEYVFYCCGPNAYIDAMFGILEGMGVPKHNLRREAWH